MATLARTTRRLPGLRFEAQPPPLAERLPRMDVAAFVGFAASGPLHLPVAVEDPAQFEAIFGADAPLAWDRARGEQARGYLGPSVRAFFRNGGRRCWVVRVAGQARSNLFPVAGLARLRSNGALAPAYARPRSRGSWSDPLQAGAVLTSRALVFGQFNSPAEFQLELSSAGEVVAGDLLRITFAEGFVPLVVVGSVEPLRRTSANVTDARGGARRLKAQVKGGLVQWFRLPDRRPRARAGRARVLTGDGRRIGARVLVPEGAEWADGGQVSLDLELAQADAPAVGSFVRALFGRRRLWLLVSGVRVLEPRGPQRAGLMQVTGEALWLYKSRPHVKLSAPVRGEKLLFEMFVRRGDSAPTRLSDLAFTARHQRFWSALPTDEALYGGADPGHDNSHAEVWRAAQNPRFPLAGRAEDKDDAVYFPVVMPAFSPAYLGPLKKKADALTRDGLANFGAGLFLDRELRGVGLENLLTQADFLRYQSPRPRRLYGIHAALALEEATIISVPDAVHRGWEFREVGRPEPEPPRPLAHPEWWAYQECDPHAAGQAVLPERQHRARSDPGAPVPPKLFLAHADQTGLLALKWSLRRGANYILEEATHADWADAAVVPTGAENRVSLRRPAGTYFYRVRTTEGGREGDWSEPIVARVPERGHFLDCRLAPVAPPTLLLEDVDVAGTLTLSWSSPIDERRFVVEEAASPDWFGAARVYAGPQTRLVLRGRGPGRKTYFRARTEIAGFASDWEEVVGVFGDEGDLVLTWEPRLEAGYVLEEATRTDWADAEMIYEGQGTRLSLYSRRAGDYFYRVRATVGGRTSDWSEPVAARVGGAGGWDVKAPEGFRADTLLEVHCALLRMCAARGDLFALLSLPEHYRDEDAVRHAAGLRPFAGRPPSPAPAPSGALVPLGFGETRALSYGALYHPWPVSRGEGARLELRRTPPCGAAAGVMARRAIERGAWVAPANEPLRDVVALVPPIQPASRLPLQEAQINLVRQEPRGFITLAAETLSDDEALRPIGVRRLLILLRRLALRLGATYVFEPHSDAFRRQVKRGFEGLLGEMFERGAFAGATPSASFQVNTGSELNTPQLTDLGRFIVELKVAPSLPLVFLTLRLVQTGDRGLAAEEV